MLKLKKILTPILASVIVLSSSANTANATSLADSFYYGTWTESGNSRSIGTTVITDVTKKCMAGTTGYSPYHYVRAYIGGSKSGPNSYTVADTERKWFYGDGKAVCQYTNSVYSNDYATNVFPIGYAKYGN